MNFSALRDMVPQKVIDELPVVMAEYRIIKPISLAHFLGQCYHESGGFQYVFENFNYRPESLCRLWPRHFRDLYEAQFFAGRPEHIANKIYGGRMGNGTDPTGDGWRYRGRGYIQLTGKNNYTLFDAVVPENIVENPDYVATKYPLVASAWFWRLRKVNGLIKATDAVTDEDVIAVTKRVNGGQMGITHRKTATQHIYQRLTHG